MLLFIGCGDDGIKAYNRGIELYQQAYQRTVGSAERRQGMEEAARWFGSAVQERPRLGESYFCLGLIQLEELDELEGARRSFEQALELFAAGEFTATPPSRRSELTELTRRHLDTVKRLLGEGPAGEAE